MKPDVNVRYAHRWIYMLSEPIDYSRVKFFKIAVDTVGAAKEKKFARQELCGHFSVYGKKWTNFFVITVFYILKQLSTSVSIKMVDINLAASQLSKNPPLFTSIWVKNC